MEAAYPLSHVDVSLDEIVFVLIQSGDTLILFASIPSKTPGRDKHPSPDGAHPFPAIPSKGYRAFAASCRLRSYKPATFVSVFAVTCGNVTSCCWPGIGSCRVMVCVYCSCV